MNRTRGKTPVADGILHFWFQGEAADRRWFAKDEAFDAEVRSRYGELIEEGIAGRLSGWKACAGDCLALIVLLDQLPRNAWRGSPRAFAGDAVALEAAREAIALGHDGAMCPAEKMFAYLPFEHSESLADQELACELMRSLEGFPETADAYRYALAHRGIIERFGRFPHRNAILGRASTPEELAFLREPGSAF